MKQYKNIYFILLLFSLIGFVSCEKEEVKDFSDIKFVRINQQSITISVGESYKVIPIYDSEETAAKKFTWSTLDSTIATIATNEDNSGIITGISEGQTIIKIESEDGKLKYFSTLIVRKDRIIKILAIGDSFSEDAVENYLYDLAASDDIKVIIGNMYLEGSSLEQHWENAAENNAAYQFRKIGVDGIKNQQNEVTLKSAFKNENWDFISFQEASHLAGKINGYEQYLPKLVEYAKSFVTNPNVKFLLHQLWAYAHDSNHEGFINYDKDQIKMFNAIVEAVWEAKSFTDIEGIIPVGTAIQNGRTSYIGDKFTRNGQNLSYNIGRFTAACTWFESLFEINVLDNPFIPNTLTTYDASLAKTAAHAAILAPQEITILNDYLYPEPNNFVLKSPIYIDFGPILSESPFNNYMFPTDLKLGNLKDEKGEETGFGIEVSMPFTGALDRGLENSLGFPKTASQDMFFSDGIFVPKSGFILSNLNKNLKYTFIFYGSINDIGTETEYRVMGENEESAFLVNDYNDSRVAIIRDIIPKDDATIEIQLQPGPGNIQWAKFFGVNVMLIVPEGYQLSFN